MMERGIGTADRPMLALRGVAAGYGGPAVLHDITLSVSSGEIVALLGPNGAGKTTILNAISGLVGVMAGEILLAGEALTTMPPHKVMRRGVTHVPQGRMLFPYSNGEANLRIGGYCRPDRPGLEEDIAQFVEAWPIAKRVLRRPAELMSGGEQQIIAIGRALMSRPRVLLLDEPSLGLAPVTIAPLFELIGSLASVAGESQDGLAILLVEQNIRKALQVAHRAYVLVNGTIVYRGPTDDLSPDDVLELYLNGSAIEESR